MYMNPFSFYPVSPRDRTQVVRLVSKHLYPLSSLSLTLSLHFEVGFLTECGVCYVVRLTGYQISWDLPVSTLLHLSPRSLSLFLGCM